MGQQFGDTTLTKVFVGGLAWETQLEALREHFQKYGDILEAVIITDKITGRSKGYGFVTFKEAEAAKKACEDSTPVIFGRRANCNLASLGAKRSGGGGVPPAPLPSHHLHRPVPLPGTAVASRGVSSGPPAPWYYHPSTSGTPPPPPPPPPSPFHYHGTFPFYAPTAAYGYAPNYVADSGNSTKLSHGGRGGFYQQGQFPYPNGLLPVYPLYHFQSYQSPGMGVPARSFAPAEAASGSAMATIPNITSMSKPPPPPPTVMPPPPVTVEQQVTGCS